MNNYEILGVKRTATQEDIKKAYKNLVKKYHPDVYKGDKSFAEKKTAEINEAYDILSNSEKRKLYDMETFPQTEYNYTPPKYNYNSSGYTYTPPKYNQTYDEYKHKYTNTYSYQHNENTNDGSEHDYYTYTNYHTAQNNNNNTDSYQTNVIFDKFYKKINTSNKDVLKVIFFIFFIIYFFIIIHSLYQLFSVTNSSSTYKPTIFLNNKNEVDSALNYKYNNKNYNTDDYSSNNYSDNEYSNNDYNSNDSGDNDYYNNEHSSNNYNSDDSIDNNYSSNDYNNNYYNNNYYNSNNDYNNNNYSSTNTYSNPGIKPQYFDIYDIFGTEEEIQNYYYQRKPNLPEGTTYEEFKNNLINQLNPYK